MLVLTRKAGESIIINDDIKITIAAVRGSQVRVGIEAPRNVAVHREEIYLAAKSLAGDKNTFNL